MEEALALQHPFDSSEVVEDDVKTCIFKLLVQGPKETANKREEAIRYYSTRAEALQNEDDSLRDKLPAEQQRLIAGKRVLLLAEMCRDAGVEDDGLMDLQLAGAHLTGTSGTTGLFPSADAANPAMDDEQLMKSSRWSRRMIMGRDSTCSDPELNDEVWRITVEEVSKGWLQGPMTEDQVAKMLGPLFVISPRFGIRQSDKIRPIDDMSISMVNSAFTPSYRLELDGVDGIAVLARAMMGAISDDRRVCLQLKDGSQLIGTLRESLSLDDARTMLGRALDLDAAYKRLMVRKSSLWASVLQVRGMKGDPHLFVSQVLPFGASAAVYSFSRFSKAFQQIGSRLFGLAGSCYFDDFTQFDLAVMGCSARSTAEQFLDLVGWRYSLKEAKRIPMAANFDVLGVSVDLSSSRSGLVVLRNKESRVKQIRQEVTEIINAGTFPMAVASSLRGRLQFAESQIQSNQLVHEKLQCQGQWSETRKSSGRGYRERA